LLRRVELLVRRLQLLVRRQHLLVRRLQLLVRRLELLDDGLEILPAARELLLERGHLRAALPRRATDRRLAGDLLPAAATVLVEQDQEVRPLAAAERDDLDRRLPPAAVRAHANAVPARGGVRSPRLLE